MTSDAAPPLDRLEPSPPQAMGAGMRPVADELEAIFGTPPSGQTGGPSTQRLAFAGGREDRPAADRRLATMGGIVAAAFLGIAAGAFVMAREAQRVVRKPAVASSITVEAARAETPPAPGPLDPLAGVPAPPQAAAAPSEPRAAAPLAASRRIVAANRRPPAKLTRPGPTAREVAAADRRLRQAYWGAIRAGVPRPVLASYRNRWEATRRTRAHEPRLLVARYAVLASQLDRAAARAQGSTGRIASRSRWRPLYAPWRS